MSRKALMLGLLVFAAFAITGCYDREADAKGWKELSAQDAATARSRAIDLANARSYSLIERKGGGVLVLCWTSAYQPDSLPVIEALFAEPYVAAGGTPGFCSEAATKRGDPVSFGSPMSAERLLEIKRIAPFDPNDPIYRELATRSLYGFWRALPQPPPQVRH